MPKEGAMAQVTSETIFSTGPVKCVQCDSFYKPDGVDGPDCRCSK